MTHRLAKTVAGVFIGLIMFTSQGLAGGHPQLYRLVLPCVPISAWVEMAGTNNLEPIDARVDDDGDTWIIWEGANGVWRSTLTVSGGSVICMLGGRGRVMTLEKRNL